MIIFYHYRILGLIQMEISGQANHSKEDFKYICNGQLQWNNGL